MLGGRLEISSTADALCQVAHAGAGRLSGGRPGFLGDDD